MTQRLQHQLVLNVAGFRVFRAQEFSPSRQIVEEMFGFDQRPRGFATSSDSVYLSTIDQDLCSFDRIIKTGGQPKARNAGDARQSFSSETKRMNVCKVIAGPNLTGGVALQT
jgi:hypothetical protein